MNKKETSWGKVALWYDDLLSDQDSYQAKVILPNLIRVLSPRAGESVLDIGCGQGFFSHEVATKGATVKGFDISPELIDLAKKRSKPNETFTVLKAGDSFPYPHGTTDKAFAVLSLQNIKNIDETIKEIKNTLKKGGKFILVLNHPAFRVPKQSDWGFDEKREMQFRKVYAYMSEQTVPIDMHPGKDLKNKVKEQTLSFHRPLQYYFKFLAKYGFAVTRLEEWISHKKSERGPKQLAEDLARKEIPLFMMIEATKL